jgi:hypothetical protein
VYAEEGERFEGNKGTETKKDGRASYQYLRYPAVL